MLDMLALWSAGREYAVQDLVIFALTAVVGLVLILIVFWFLDNQKKVPQRKIHVYVQLLTSPFPPAVDV